MEIILLQDVQNLGSRDDIVNVRDGYGRNYLIPKKMAIVANVANKKVMAENARQRAHKEAKIKEEAVALAARFEGLELVIGAKTSSTGKIFGSVNTIQIAEAINKLGIEIDRKQIMLDDGIKEIGKHEAKIKLHKEVIINVNFEVVSE